MLIDYSTSSTYFIIQKYTEIIPDFPLFFTFAKHNIIFKYIYPFYKEDVLQTIALACLSEGTLRERNLLLQRELYHFHNHIVFDRPYKREKKDKKKYKKYKPDYFNHCDICKKDKKEYMYKTFLPGKVVCNMCRRQHIRKYIDPNYCKKKK